MNQRGDGQPRPFVWQMIRDAVNALGGATTNVAVRDWIPRHEHPEGGQDDNGAQEVA